jgi:hypothetical protein
MKSFLLGCIAPIVTWLLVIRAEGEPPSGDSSDPKPALAKIMEASVDWYKLLPDTKAFKPLKPQVVMSWRNAERGEQAKDMLVYGPTMGGLSPWRVYFRMAANYGSSD